MPPAPLHERLRQLASTLERQFLGKDEIIRLLMISVVAGEHCVLLGPPGTAKSALIRSLSELMQANYFEYLLTRFTEPNEIFGPVDIVAFREGTYRRNTQGMLPEAEVVFLDEVFKANSAILNALLTLLNERKFTSGGKVMRCPLISVFAASNEVPGDETLNAIFDRFLLRVHSDNLDAYHFSELLQRGIQHEIRQMSGEGLRPVVTARELADLGKSFGGRMNFSDAFLSAYKGIVFQIRAEGISLSDRRVVKMLKLFAASAYLDGRNATDASDFFVLKHIWNNQDQAAILEGIVQPVLEAFFREHPDRRRVGALGVGVDALAAEIDRIRQLLTGGTALGDVQLFSQLKALGEIKTALAGITDPRARELEKRVAQLLEASFRSGRFAQI
ncbi:MULTISPECIES: AAA family ATPase [Polyangium]|uniref:AAA family ATPase n=2 Tax=Polyangium TaxID=55 RepID=A0A4U1J7T8_9BACT|nr:MULTISPECIES: AAA family ATPase [Polyangium]MDI1434164.1 AAA family ATPase [Polyangium sorediatum]TKD03265.1 AAA family ATPase [Polyangium fumosum]